jgi:hypothetical protein
VPEAKETIIIIIEKITELGGMLSQYDVIFTNTRIIVDRSNAIAYVRDIIKNDKVSATQWGLTFGIAGTLLNSFLTKKTVEDLDRKIDIIGTEREKIHSIEDIIKFQKKPFVVNYDELKKIKLQKKIRIPLKYMGYSQLEIDCKGKNKKWVFTGDKFDAVSSELVKLIPGRVEMK